MSGTSVDTLSQLIRASLITHGIAPDDINVFETHSTMLSTIDSTPLGDVPWQGFSITYDGPLCYVRAERSARLELRGYDQVALLVVDGASASGTR